MRSAKRKWVDPVGSRASDAADRRRSDPKYVALEKKYETALAIAQQRCASCHAGASAPLGVDLTSADGLRRHASAIEDMVSSGAMPPGNATGLTDEERAQLVAWAKARG